MKKIGLIFSGIFLMLIVFTTSCDVLYSAAVGADLGSQGYTMIGYGSSAYPDAETCSLVCHNEGYSSYYWTGTNSSNGYQCWCK